MTDLLLSIVARWKHTQSKSIDNQCFNLSIKNWFTYLFLSCSSSPTSPFRGTRSQERKSSSKKGQQLILTWDQARVPFSLEVLDTDRRLNTGGGLEHGLLLSSLPPPDQRELLVPVGWTGCVGQKQKPHHLSTFLGKACFFCFFLWSHLLQSDVLVCIKGALSSWTVLVLSPVKAVWFSVVLEMRREWPSHQHSDPA